MSPGVRVRRHLREQARQVRWRAARHVAPEPIMRDPYPSEDGVFVLYRKRGEANGSPYEFTWILRAERFRLKATHRLASLDFGRDDFTYQPSKSFVRFVGAVCR